ncbi:MAG: hypothetical protein ACJA1A_000975 [Saprospiraceae bacterium]
MQDLLLITPPFTQLNTPYPATAYIKGFLNTKGVSAFQMDLGIEVILRLFSKSGLSDVFDKAQEQISDIDNVNIQRISALRQTYIATIDEVILFLQGKNLTLARQICTDNFLPRASRFDQLDDMDWAFGNMGMQDKAKHLATLYLEDLSDFIVATIDDNFGFSRYAERLGRSANSFDEIYETLENQSTYIDCITLKILAERLQEVNPKLVCLSVPFPGNLYSAFRCGQYIKKHHPDIKVAMGGGFANTELRSVTDVRVFEFWDYISLDDGELPLELLVSNVLDPIDSNPNYNFLKRTFQLQDGEVIYNNFSLRQDYKQATVGTPDYSDLLLDSYISVIEIANPMHSLWSDGRWNKLTMAHGCYWGKCTFCDVSLDYIGKYEPVTAKLLVDRMEEIITQTGEKGFHFVDEAAPPKLMREVALEILRRGLVVSWWTNIRFEKSFTWDLCRLLKSSGCIAVSGGLEVASDRLLALIQKGVTVEQVARVTRNLTESGIMVHSYLMYGYPTQTVQETVDSLEMVRQLFELGVIQSGFWHQFALTAHSPVGLDPDSYGIIPDQKEISFANNDVEFVDSTALDHGQFSEGLKKSLFNYMHGVCFEFPLQDWFNIEIPETSIDPNFIEGCLGSEGIVSTKPSSKIVWLGSAPIVEKVDGSYIQFTFHLNDVVLELEMESAVADWFISVFPLLLVNREEAVTFSFLKKNFEEFFDDFDSFWNGEVIERLRDSGLVII